MSSHTPNRSEIRAALEKKATQDPAAFAQSLRDSPLAAIVNWPAALTKPNPRTGTVVPIVTAHGMARNTHNVCVLHVSARRVLLLSTAPAG